MTTQLQQGIEAARSGDRQTARKLLYQVTQQEPDNEKAWGWMCSVCNTDQERIHCLKQVVRINPANEKARQQLERLETPDPFQTADFSAPPPPRQPVAPKPQDTTPWYRTKLVYILTFLFLTPIWAILILSDKKQTSIVKAFAAIVAAGYLIFWCLPVGLGALSETSTGAADCIAIDQSRCTSEQITGIARNTCDRPVEFVILRGSIANQDGLVVANNTGFTASDRITPGAISEFSIYLDSSYWDRSNCYLDVESAFFAP